MVLKQVILRYLERYSFLKQFIKFCIVGGTSAVIHLVFLHSLTEWAGIWYVASSVVGFIFSGTFNFTANKLWTFRNREKGRQIINQAVRFISVMVSGLIINTTIIYCLTEFVGFDYRISWLFAASIIAFWNFNFNRFWTFRHRQISPSLPLE